MHLIFMQCKYLVKFFCRHKVKHLYLHEVQSVYTINISMENREQPADQYSDIDRVPLSIMEHMSGYWKLVADRKKRQHDVSIRRIIIGQLVTIFVVGLSTLFIEEREALLLVGSTLLLYPALTDLLMSSGSVLSANLHHDIERQDESPYRFSLFAIMKSIFATTIASLIVGSVAGAIGLFVLEIPFLSTLQLATPAALTGKLTNSAMASFWVRCL